MSDDIMNFDLPVERSSIIKVLGIGGGGNNAVNHMYEKGITDVNFVICNTDHQALLKSQVPTAADLQSQSGRNRAGAHRHYPGAGTGESDEWSGPHRCVRRLSGPAKQ